MKLALTDRSLSRYHLVGTLLVVCLLALLMGGSFIALSLSEHGQILDRLENSAAGRKEARLRSEMAAAINHLEYINARTEATLRKALAEKLDMAMQTAQAIYDREHRRRPAAQVQSLIIEALRPQRFFDGRGYYFIDDLRGRCILLPTAPDREGQSLWNNQDDRGHYIMRGLIDAAQSGPQGGYSSYRWYTPESPGLMSDKLALARLFKPYGWVIGTGDYLYKWQQAQLNEGLERLRAWKFGDTGSFIAIGLDGRLLLQPQWPEYEGRHFSEVGTPEEQQVRQRLIELGRGGGGIMEYPWLNRAANTTGRRTALAQAYPPWKLVLIASIFEQEMATALAVERETERRTLAGRIPYLATAALAAIALAIIASLLFSRWMGGRIRAYQTRIEDHTRALEKQAGELLLAGHVFASTREGIVITDADSRILAVNQAFTDITGYARDEVIGKTPAVLSSGRHDAAFYAALWQALRAQGSWSGEIWNRRKDGGVFPELVNISAVRDEAGQVLHYVGIFLDITERKEAENRIRRLAEFDPLTELPNRSLLQDRLSQAMALAQRQDQQLAVLFIDLDRFKNINDSLGHATGDRILREVARRLRQIVRNSDTVARLGGDEFVVLLGGLHQAGQALPTAQKILSALGQPYFVDGNELQVTPSIGIALFPDNGRDSETLLKNADAAMYHAKNSGRNTFQFFTAEFNLWVTERLTIENGLRHAIARQELLLHYQPQVDLASGRIVGCEALLRWQPAGAELVGPDRFIPVAEETGLINPIGAWVLDEACRQLARWDAAGAPPIRMAVNVAVPQLRKAHFAQLVRDTLARHRIAPERLEIEVTESIFIDQDEQIRATLGALDALGVQLSLDDFGTGYSSLSYLRKFRFDVLKIDQSFVRDLEHSRENLSLIRAIVSMARDLSLSIIAEGIESEAQRDALREVGCGIGQGYHFSRPVPAPIMTQLLTPSLLTPHP